MILRILCLLLPLSAAAQDMALPAVTVVPVERHVMVDRVIVSGPVRPRDTVQVQPLIDGQPVDALLAEVGDTVAQGDTLARLSDDRLELDAARLRAQLAQAEAAAAQADAGRIEAEAAAVEARANAARVTQLQANNATSQSAVDQARANAATAEARVSAATAQREAAQADIRVAQAQLDDLDLQLRRTEVRSPVDGLILTRNAQVGAIATGAGDPMFTLARDGAMELWADVSETDLPRLAAGQPAEVRTAAGEVVSGTVRLVEPQVGDDRLGRVRIALDGAPRAGTFAEATVVVAERTALSLPLSAVARDAEGSFALRLDGDTVRRTAVTTGIRDTRRIEVTGLAEGDRVVAKAGAFLRDGDRVDPVPAP